MLSNSKLRRPCDGTTERSRPVMLRRLTVSRTLAAAALGLALAGTGAVVAQELHGEAAIAKRKDIMKGWAGLLKEPGGMLKGETAFDLAKVQAALRAIESGSTELKTLFPDDSKTGGKTEAAPAIWEKKPEFEALWTKIGTDAKTAEGTITDEATLKAELPKVLGTCGACHRNFRQRT
jgi:cytochrome c556